MTNVANNMPAQIGELLGLPLFFGSSPSSIEAIEANGHDFYCILGYESYEVVGANNAKTVKTRPALYKVMKNIMGRIVVPLEEKDLQVNQKLELKAYFLLPRISWKLVEKMDQFFRKAFDLYGTESVVILTYDPNFLNSENPSDGWGCIAPKQKNTSHACNYELDDEFMAKKPEHVLIVGSAHSHPEMSAYASGVDHKDQKDFDGIHITYGWSKGSKATEYYAEFVMGDKEWVYNCNDLFEPFPKPPLEWGTEIDDLLEVVEKKTHTTTTSGHYSGGTYSQTTKYSGSTGHTPINTPSATKRSIKLPAGFPDPQQVTLVGTLPRESNGSGVYPKCLLCNCMLVDMVIAKGRCMACKSFLAFEDETIEDFHERYAQANAPVSAAVLNQIDPDKAEKPIHFVFQNGNELRLGIDVRAAAKK